MAKFNVTPGAVVSGTKFDDEINLQQPVGDGIVIYAEAGNDIITVTKGNKHVIDAGSGNDFVTVTSGSSDIIYLGDGNDRIDLYGSDSHTVFVDSGTNNLNINGGKNFTIYGGTDVDRLNIKGNNSNITASLGEGDDIVSMATGAQNEIHTGNGKDYLIISGGESSKFYGDEGNDTIRLYRGEGHEVQVGSGDDAILVTDANNSTIYGNSGKNQIMIFGGTGNTYYGGDEKDNITLKHNAQGVNVIGGSNATVVNIQAGDSHIIDLSNSATTATQIMAGNNIQYTGSSGRDTLTVWGTTQNLTADTGSGNDVITLRDVSHMNISAGDGNGDKLNASNVNNLSVDSAEFISLINLKNSSLLKAQEISGKGGDCLTIDSRELHLGYNEKLGDYSQFKVNLTSLTNSTIYGYEGYYGYNNIILNQAAGNTIYAKAGKGSTLQLLNGSNNNTVFGNNSTKLNINGDYNKITMHTSLSGSISGQGNHNKFYGEELFSLTVGSKAGQFEGCYNEFHFGKEDDLLTLTAINSQFNNNTIYIDEAGSSKDVIDLSTRKSSDFTLDKIEDGFVLTDLVNKGKLYLQSQFESQNVEILFANGESKNLAHISNTVEMSPLEVIHRLMSFYDNTSLSGATAWNEAVAYASNYHYNNFQELYDSLNEEISDAKAQNLTKDELLLKIYGIDLNNKDTGAINGYDANRGPVKDNHNIVVQPEGMTLQDFVYDTSHTASLPDFSYKSFGGSKTNRPSYYVDINGVRFYWNDYVIDKVADQFCSAKYETASVRQEHPDLQVWIEEKKADMRQIIAGITTSWAEGSLLQIEDAYGLSLANNSAPENNHNYFSDGKPLVEIGFYYGSTGTTARTYTNNGLYIEINLNYYQSIADVDGTRKVGKTLYNTAILENSFTHELTHATMAATIKNFSSLPFFFQEGAADLVIGDDAHRASSIRTVSDNLSKYIDLDKLNMSSSYSYAGGYALLRYLAKSSSEASGYELQNAMLAFDTDSQALSDTAPGFNPLEQKNNTDFITYSNC